MAGPSGGKVRSKGKGSVKRIGGPGGSTSSGRASKAIKEWPTWLMKKAKIAAQYGFIPLVIAIGMRSDPKPNWSQLLSPV